MEIQELSKKTAKMLRKKNLVNAKLQPILYICSHFHDTQ